MRERAGLEAGFTLIELLVVLALLGLLSALAATTLGSANEAWSRLLVRDDTNREFLAARTLLKDLLAQSYPGLVAGSGSHRYVSFAGGPDHIDFLAPLRKNFGADAIVAYSLSVSDAHVLTLTWHLEPLPTQNGNTSTQSSVALLEGIEGLSITYYGKDTTDKVAHWDRVWNEHRQLPHLVQLKLRWRNREISLLAAPLATAALCPPGVSEDACRD